MFCENCGAKVEDNAAVCTTCGAPINRSATQGTTAGPASVPMPKRFCKNCGAEMDSNAAVCVKCGFAFGVGNSFCQNCGSSTQPGQAICTNCGSPLTAQSAAAVTGNSKSRLAAGILGILLGSLGIHNFYVGKTTRGVIQLVVSLVGSVLTCGIATLAMWIWGIVEGIFYLTRHEGYTTDANGVPLSD